MLDSGWIVIAPSITRTGSRIHNLKDNENHLKKSKKETINSPSDESRMDSSCLCIADIVYR